MGDFGLALSVETLLEALISSFAKFESTCWSLVLTANRSEPEIARDALHSLCEHYWRPVYVFIRSRGHDRVDSADLTQEFFTRVLEKGTFGDVDPDKGRFRSYLLGAVKHFLSDQHDRHTAQKRGGELSFISLDDIAVEDSVLKDGTSAHPEELFDRKWAVSVLDRTLSRLEESQGGKKRKAYVLLKPLITGGASDKSYAEIGRELGLKEGSVKSAVHRMRKDYGKLLKDEIRQTLSDDADADEELKYLLSVLTG